VEVHHNLTLLDNDSAMIQWFSVQTIQIVMKKQKFSPVVGSSLAHFSSKMFLYSEKSSEYTEVAGVAKFLLASLDLVPL